MGWYSVGTVAVTQGSALVQGARTRFVGNADKGQGFGVLGGALYEIARVDSATQITLARPYAEASNAAAGYSIAPVQGYLQELAQKSAQLLDSNLTAVDEIQRAAAAIAAAAAIPLSLAQVQAARDEAVAAKNLAASSASAATASANALAAQVTSFAGAYLGSKASAPALDNQGLALKHGAEYFSTSLNKFQVYLIAGTPAVGAWASYSDAVVLRLDNAVLSASSASGSASRALAYMNAAIASEASAASVAASVAADKASIEAFSTQAQASQVSVAALVAQNQQILADLAQLSTVTTISKALTIAASWQDTGISGDNLSTGSYAVQMIANDTGAGGANTNEHYSGTMTWYSSATNSALADEIPLHRSGGGAPGNLYLRTLRSGGVLKLQIFANSAVPSSSNYVFKFRRLI